uniref:Uncharacterized protein n=1 Tax=Astyanax mexicanus TaxID=7994 RepID=A0A3B1KJA2_ASTMX
VEDFLRSVTLSKLNNNQAELLDKPLTHIELTKVLSLMPNQKSPGPNGFQKLIRNTVIPQHKNTALITLILKQDKKTSECSSYCPISLINADIKNISKALSISLESVHRKCGSVKSTLLVLN